MPHSRKTTPLEKKKTKLAPAPKKTSKAKPPKRRVTPYPTNPKRVAAILAKLDEAYPGAVCELKHANPLQLLISTILSAQCTDVRVNQVTQSLYKKYRDVKALAYADPAELQSDDPGFQHYRAGQLDDPLSGQSGSDGDELQFDKYSRDDGSIDQRLAEGTPASVLIVHSWSRIGRAPLAGNHS